MDFSKLKKLNIGGIDLKQLFIDGVQVWKSGYKNWVPYSTESDGVTIYNGGLGYKNGYRVRSGGAETAMTSAACAGYIPVSGGATVRIKGWSRYTNPGNAGNAINAADASFNNIGQVSNSNYGIFAGAYAAYNNTTIKDGADGISEWVAPPVDSGIAYIRVSGYFPHGADGASLIVTINEEIT